MTSTPEYSIIYHPVIPGRAEHLRLCLEATSTPYTNIDFSPSPTPLTTHSTTHSLLPTPHFAPPILLSKTSTKTLTISQTPSILLFLGQALNLAPKPDEDEEGYYIVNQLALTALDGLSNEPHETHHPIGVSLYYEDQKPEALRRATDYRTNRLPKFLAYFEDVLSKNNAGRETWLYGANMTYADLVLFQCLVGVEYAFPKCMEGLWGSGKYERVKALKERVGQLEAVKAYLGSERRRQFGEGIYRYYEELDG